MWINVGRSQFHLPTGKPQVVRGHTGLVISGREALLDRLTSVRGKLDGTKFGFSEHNDYVEAICPWGNKRALLRAGRRALRPHLARHSLRRVRRAGRQRESDRGLLSGDHGHAGARCRTATARSTRVQMGKNQYMQFRETDAPQPAFDGHHVQMYIANFSGPYEKLKERNLISIEDNQYQYRFQDIVDLDSDKVLFTVEHEVRSATHPMYLRPLVNRNPATTNQNYANGYDRCAVGDGPAGIRQRGDAAAELERVLTSRPRVVSDCRQQEGVHCQEVALTPEKRRKR